MRLGTNSNVNTQAYRSKCSTGLLIKGTLINATFLFLHSCGNKHLFVYQETEVAPGWFWIFWFPESDGVKKRSLIYWGKPILQALNCPQCSLQCVKTSTSFVLNNTEDQCRTQRCACAAISLSHLLIWGRLSHN